MTSRDTVSRRRRNAGGSLATPELSRPDRRPGAAQVRVRLLGVGSMAVGAVEAIGSDVVGFARGDRVVFPVSRRERIDIDAAAGSGHPVETLVASADALLGVPRDVPDEHAARLLAPGLVARVLLRQLTPVGPGNRVRLLLEPGLGRTVITAWAHFLGATVAADGDTADVMIDEEAIRTAQAVAFRRGHQQVGSADVFAVIRQGVLDEALAANADARAAA